MNSLATRVLKEVRPLFWPWLIVTAVGFLGLGGGAYQQSLLFAINRLGLLVGMPLLAVLSFGREFDHGTFGLLLSQPIERKQIWFEKLSISAVAVLSSALVFYWATDSYLPNIQPNVVLWAPLAFSVAIFCTLVARSSVGGFVLSLAFLFGAFSAWTLLLNPWIEYYWALSQPREEVVAALCFAVLMLGLGYQQMARFQATGGVASGDLIVSGRGIMPSSMAGFFRCRRTGATLNMARKELGLLRPLWLITVVFFAGWICLAFTAKFTDRSPYLFDVLAVMLAVYVPLAAILAGSLSLGEERMSGMHSWHLTLPVSARLHWFIKLTMALFATCICALLIPALAANALWFDHGATLTIHEATLAWMQPNAILIALTLTFAAFWCACARKGTLTAALLVFPVVGAILTAWACGVLTAVTLDPVKFFRLRPIAPQPIGELFPLIAMLCLGVIQSYKMFRMPPEDAAVSVIRPLLPLLLITFLWSFVLKALGMHG